MLFKEYLGKKSATFYLRSIHVLRYKRCSLIWEMLPSVKIILTAPIIRVDKLNANKNIDFIKLLESNYSLLIKHPNIVEEYALSRRI